MSDAYYYCVQCTDVDSQEVGDFIHKGDFRAISPVFPGLAELYLWIRDNGYRSKRPYSYELLRDKTTS